jgi:hypothetical protein
MVKHQILIVEDDQNILQELKKNLLCPLPQIRMDIAF